MRGESFMSSVAELRRYLHRNDPQAILPAAPATPSDTAPRSDLSPRWSWAEMVGRLAEISSLPGGSALSVGVGWVLNAQQAGELVAWIASPKRLFFPPDLDANGVDLNALAVVRVEGAKAAGRAADKLLRSGSFGLVVLDLGKDHALPQALRSRLVGLAQKHEAAVAVLTEKSSQHASVGSLVSLRAQAKRMRLGTGRFAYELDIIKDKRRGPGWIHREARCGPLGLR